MELNRRTQYGLQQNKTRTNILTVPSPLQRKQRRHRHHRLMYHRTRRGTKEKQNYEELKPIAFASRYLNDAGKKHSIGVVWRLENFRFYLYGKQFQLFSNHQALEPLLKETNQQTVQRPNNKIAR